MNKKLKFSSLLLLSFSLAACTSKPVELAPEDTDYSVTFLNYDDTVLCQTKVRGGTCARYMGEVPLKDPTESEYFTFSNWDYDLAQPIYSNLLIRPLFTSETRKYIVTFVNWDDTVVETVNVEYGSYASYRFTPTRSSDDDHFEYHFSGWDNDPMTTVIYGDTTFRATFSLVEYVLGRFLNYNGNILSHAKVVKGSNFTYKGKTPTRASDNDRVAYEFSTWDKSLNNVTVDTDFVAQFRTIEYVYATFYNYDGKRISTSKVEKGKTPTYLGSTPIRTSTTSNMKYKFKGWDKTLGPIYGDTSYTAVFDLINIWTVTFKNWDGAVLQAKDVEDGGSVTYTGSTPTRASTISGDYEYMYLFSGWSGSMENIRSNTVLTAQYSSTYRVTGKTAVLDYLYENGSGTYHVVQTADYGTGNSSTLGYDGSQFTMSHYDTRDDMDFTILITASYGASSGTGTFRVKSGYSTTFMSTMTVNFLGHQFASTSNVRVTTNAYSSSVAADLALLTLTYLKIVVRDTTSFLEDEYLPYIV